MKVYQKLISDKNWKQPENKVEMAIIVKEYVAICLLHMAILPLILVLKRLRNKFCTFGKKIQPSNDKPEELRTRGKSCREHNVSTE